MAELLRTNVSAPPLPLDTRQSVSSAGKTSRALGQLAELGAAGVQLYTKEHEVKMAGQAMNDLVNDAVNPDLQEHEAAYAQIIAQGTAMKGYSTRQQQIKDGQFNRMEPEDFQQLLLKGHNEYKESISKSKYSALEAAEYDKYWLKNGSTLTAGQAGMYRNYKGVQQQQALFSQLAIALETPNISVDKLEELATDPKYSLLNEDNVLDTIMTSGISYAQTTPKDGLRLLLDMQDKFHFDLDPARSKTFRAAITKARKDINSIEVAATRKEEIQLVQFAQDLVDAGNFNADHIEVLAREQKPNGQYIWTPRQLVAMKTQSDINRANANLQESYKKSFKSGVDIYGAPKKDWTKIVRAEWAEQMLRSGNNTIQAVEGIGRFLVNQTHVWNDLKGKAVNFQAQPMLNGREIDRTTMQQFDELQALERGMHKNEKRFKDYIGESFLHYESIKEALALTGGLTKDEAWVSIADSLERQKETAKKQQIVSQISTEAMSIGQEIAKEVLQTKDVPWIPNIIEQMMAPGDKGDRVALVAAQAYEQAINENWSPELAIRQAKAVADAQTFRWGGEYYDLQNVKPEVLFGTADYNGVFRTMIEDPVWNAKLKDMFGVTLGEMYFGVDETELIEEREDKTLFVAKENIIKEINVGNGTLDFRTEQGLGTDFSIPLRDLGIAHEAKQQGMEEIEQLDRLYGKEYQATEEGKAWSVKQSALNDDYLTNVLSTTKATGRTTMTPEEYVGMPDIEKTRNRKLFHKANYTGVLGTFSKIMDYFGAKRAVDTMIGNTVIKGIRINEGVGVRHNNPGNMIYIPGMKGASKGEYKHTDEEGKKWYWAKYETPEEGFDGLVRQVGVDEERGHDLSSFIHKFAPKEDNNDTEAYIKYIAGKLDVQTDTSLKDINNTELAKVVASYESKTTFE